MKKLLMLLSVCAVAFSCNGLRGDNSDYDFGDGFSREDVYEEGYEHIDGTIRLMTYNVHRCKGPNNGPNTYDDIGYVLETLAPEVCAIQELDSCTTANNAYQLQEVADRAKMKYIYCPAISQGNGLYGIGLVYSPSLAVRSIYKEHLPGVEPRMFLAVEFDDFIYIATHLCHREGENRRESLRIIKTFIDEVYPETEKSIYLAGDLNEYSTTNEFGKMLSEDWLSLGVTSGTYFNTTTPRRIDYILAYKPNGTSRRTKVVGCAIPQFQAVDLNLVSDHYPVIVDIKKGE